ncbi:P-loop containing nucleoside triphosphate hydrolase [Sesbania bispinosa]|nr:P-loop containing nucleoside triphosphate hydrolase [Sesbania bispinosa]
MAVMGPSGCGKTTLLDSLAVLCSSRGTFLGTLTVRESLTYSANMRLPSKMTKEEINEVVEETIMEMGLEDCADNNIGNWHLRGISNGEKKRLSIALEILTQPQVLLLDEPTSGLDSASAFYVIQALSNIACNGKIVICSIHQPSSETFNLLMICFCSHVGKTVYFGEAKMALKFFADAGFPCPTRRNPSDHFILCINLDFDLVTASLARSHLSLPSTSNLAVGMKTTEVRATLIESYKSSELMINARRRIQQLKPNEEQVTESNLRSTTSWCRQLCTLTKRSFLNMTRDMDNNSILARGKCLSFIYGFMICLSCGGLPFFIEELKVQRALWRGCICTIKCYIIISFPSSNITLLWINYYFMVQFHPASLVPNVLMGIGTATGVIIFMMMSSQIFRPLPDIPKIFWRYPMSYLSFAAWAVQGQYKNDMLGLEFDPLLSGYPKVSGEQVLTTNEIIDTHFVVLCQENSTLWRRMFTQYQ